MATKPKIVTLSNNSVDVLNAIRNSASINYRDYVPIATADADSIREIGATIMDYPALQNEFLNALVNRIGRVILTSKSYQNPWAMFKKGFLEFGETIEEVFTNLAKPFQFDPAVAENEIFKREIPDVRSAFHVLNYQKFYKATVSQEQLRMAFMSWDGVTSLISSIVESMYTAANYDEFITMKYLLCKRMVSGEMYWANPLTDMSQLTGKDIVKSIRQSSDNLTFLSPKYNLAGVYNSTEKNNQYIIIPSKWMAEFDVEVLAAAFNMDKVEFMGHVVLVDSFNDLDTARLSELFKDDPTYTELSENDIQYLQSVAAVLVDKDFFMIFDNLQNFTENYNGQGLYWNYFYHVWKTFSTSPYANAILFTNVGGTGWEGATITVTPGAATVLPGQSVQLKAAIDVSPFASKAIDWESSSQYATVNKSGVVTVLANATKGTTITITAKAHAHPETTGTATITVG